LAVLGRPTTASSLAVLGRPARRRPRSPLDFDTGIDYFPNVSRKSGTIALVTRRYSTLASGINVGATERAGKVEVSQGHFPG
jgi:hypothetical protein